MNTLDALLATILSSSFTKQDVLRRLRLLREYFEKKLFSANASITLSAFLKSVHANASDTEIISSWGNAFINTFTKDNVYGLLNEMTEKIKELPAINVYLPVAPDEKEAVKLGKWFRQNVRPDVILEIHVDASMVGGCGFATKGFFKDYSLRHYIDKKREEIRNIIGSYAIKSSESQSSAGGMNAPAPVNETK